MRKITILGTGHIGLAAIVHEAKSLQNTGVEVVIVENEKKEQRPFHKDEPYIITRLQECEMSHITDKDISKGKKFYTDISNKRNTKKKKR